MLEISLLRDKKDRVISGLRKKYQPEEILSLVDVVVSLDDKRKELQTELDMLLSQINVLSAQIGELFKSGKHQEANALKSEVAGMTAENKSAALYQMALEVIPPYLGIIVVLLALAFWVYKS